MSDTRLAAMKPEDEWVDKFYAALAELWTAVKGTEIPAMPEPPHIVMARLIEDVAWAGRAVQDDGLDVERLAEALRNTGIAETYEGYPWNPATVRRVTEEIAAEYARLRAASPLNASTGDVDGTD